MPVDDLASLYKHLPELFARRTDLDTDWDTAYVSVPLGNSIELPEIFGDGGVTGIFNADETQTSVPVAPVGMLPNAHFPGADYRSERFTPLDSDPEPGGPPYPPPDAFAFYLPFHYYYPDYWGIYLTFEGVSQLATFILRKANGVLDPTEAWLVAQRFLYLHEYFHHRVEAFATRIELLHRVPVYTTGFQEVYRSELLGAGLEGEEQLATAYAWTETTKLFAGNARKSQTTSEVLAAYIEKLPIQYCCTYWIPGAYPLSSLPSVYREFCSINLSQSLRFPVLDHGIWRAFRNALAGMPGLARRVSYITHRNSPISQRLSLQTRFISYRDLTRKLKQYAGCDVHRNGKGSHERWKSPKGGTFSVPRHPGDLKQGTLRKILADAGLQMSLSEFIALR